MVPSVSVASWTVMCWTARCRQFVDQATCLRLALMTFSGFESHALPLGSQLMSSVEALEEKQRAMLLGLRKTLAASRNLQAVPSVFSCNSQVQRNKHAQVLLRASANCGKHLDAAWHWYFMAESASGSEGRMAGRGLQ